MPWALDLTTRTARIVYLYPTMQEVVENARVGGTICEVPDQVCSILEQPWPRTPAERCAILDYIDNLPEEQKVKI